MTEQNGKFYFMKGEVAKLSEHFSTHEFTCQCSEVDCKQQVVSKKLIEMLEKIRKLFGEPIKVTSGYRCRTHNLKEGGKQFSTHLTGEGADLQPVFQYTEMNDLQRACDKVAKAMGVSTRFIHVDTRVDKIRRWTY